MYFIILTTALTLHAHGLKNITTSRQAAEALEPLAGDFAATLYTIGLIGVGFLAIPTLTGSAAYAFAEIFKWRQGFAKFMQLRAPLRILLEIVRDPFRQQNVSAITAIHHPLRNVDPGAGNVGL